MTGVYLETGTKRVFASAVDWPGWCRSGRGEEQALEALATTASRYAVVPALAGVSFRDWWAKARIIGRIEGHGLQRVGRRGA